jgi:hypothetical protein
MDSPNKLGCPLKFSITIGTHNKFGFLATACEILEVIFYSYSNAKETVKAGSRVS